MVPGRSHCASQLNRFSTEFIITPLFTMCRALLISLCVAVATATEIVTTPKVSITNDNTTYECPAGSTLPDHTLLWKVVYHVASECDQMLDTVVMMQSENMTHAMNASETAEDFTFVVGRNLSKANATVVSVQATDCAVTVHMTLYYDAIDTTELHSVEGAPTVINGLTDLSLMMDNVYATSAVLTLTSDCVSGVAGFLVVGGEPMFFANLSTEMPTYTLDVDVLVEDQLVAGVMLVANDSCDGGEVEMQLTGHYYNFSSEITVAPPTAEPTAQPTAHPTAHPTAQPTAEPTAQPSTPTTPVPETMSPEDGSGSGSSGLAKGVVAAIVVVSIVAVAGAAGVYFYCKKVSERNAYSMQEQTGLIHSRD